MTTRRDGGGPPGRMKEDRRRDGGGPPGGMEEDRQERWRRTVRKAFSQKKSKKLLTKIREVCFVIEKNEI